MFEFEPPPKPQPKPLYFGEPDAPPTFWQKPGPYLILFALLAVIALTLDSGEKPLKCNQTGAALDLHVFGTCAEE